MKIRKLSKQLLKKSQESFLLAIEVYNKPTIDYRLESFCIFFVNTWELLLKSKIIEDSKNARHIFIKNKSSKKETISLDKCLRKVFQDPKNPVRKNIEDIAELRHSAVHLLIPELDIIYSGVFQQGVFNYSEYLEKWFNCKLKISPRLLTLIFEFNPDSISEVTLRKKYNSEIVKFFIQSKNTINKRIQQFKKNYSISINYKLAFVKDPKKADLLVATNDKYSVAGGLLIEIPKDPTKTHPYLTNKVFLEVKKIINTFKLTYLYAINHIENINENNHPEFLYRNKISKNSPKQYSKKYVDFIIRKSKCKRYIQETYRKYKEYTKNRRRI